MNPFHSHRTWIASVLILAVGAPLGFSQSTQEQGASGVPRQVDLKVASSLPQADLSTIQVGDVTLLPGLFRDRRALTKSYLMRLKTDNLLQDYYLEAGIRLDTPYDQLHQGWEAPHSQLRGHFLGHWMSAAAHMAQVDHDPFLQARLAEIVQDLKRCQALNGGLWVGSIPEKYFTIMENGTESIWSPQYTLHKTMLGLLDAYRVTGSNDALGVLEKSADWFADWSERLVKAGKADVVYRGECCGMLELWADLYSITGNPKYLQLAGRYANPDLFQKLLAGQDPLTDDHANASIPWFQGAARLYEVTGDERYRRIVEAFWKDAVEDRGMFATTGANAGEFWIPPHAFGRFLGSRTQEHCTVYNLIRVANCLLRWTGDARYADYIERALYNGTLAQQNPSTGLVSYFLPLAPGAKKEWGSETHDFWCCQGTLVQADSIFEDLIYYRANDGITVSQFIPSQATLGPSGHQVRLELKWDERAMEKNFVRTDGASQFAIRLAVDSDSPESWTLRIRKPAWAAGPASVAVDGAPVAVPPSRNGFLEFNRSWKHAVVTVAFPKSIAREYLPGDNTRYALLDGPIVLAAITGAEPRLSASAAITPQFERQYIDGQDWQTGHFWAQTQLGTTMLKPVYEVADENYSVYFSQ